ncbi:hypothetical protein ACVWYG_001482 [Pedobacter sp. UYEF25]
MRKTAKFNNWGAKSILVFLTLDILAINASSDASAPENSNEFKI